MDQVIIQTTAKSSEAREYPKTVPSPVVPPPPIRQSVAPVPPLEGKPAQGNSHAHARERRERVLHKAVCADCHKDCEVPFKPTGERPVYCKECFSKRKGSHSPKNDHVIPQPPSLPKEIEPVEPPRRQVVVTKKGVGKVTVSEIVHSPARDTSHKEKSHKPAKKPGR